MRHSEAQSEKVRGTGNAKPPCPGAPLLGTVQLDTERPYERHDWVVRHFTSTITMMTIGNRR